MISDFHPFPSSAVEGAAIGVFLSKIDTVYSRYDEEKKEHVNETILVMENGDRHPVAVAFEDIIDLLQEYHEQ